MSIEVHLTNLFQDIETSAQAMKNDSVSFLQKFPFLPPTIGPGDGRMIFISQEGADAVFKISQIIRNNTVTLKASLSENDMADLTGKVIGQLLFGDTKKSQLEFSTPSDIKMFKRSLTRKIEASAKELNETRTHLFGVWIFHNTPISSVKIGPVEFLPREDWIRKSTKSGLLTKAQGERISNRWRGKEVRPLKRTTFKTIQENDIADAIGTCTWSCEVTVVGHSINRSREKAVIAARIALSAIALSWNNSSSSMRGTGLLFDLGPSYSRTTLAYTGKRIVTTSHQNIARRGKTLRTSDIQDFITQSKKRFVTVGRALESFLAIEPHEGSKPKLEGMLCRSLMWFGEACREQLDFIAIVKLAAALDTLAKGRHADGICDLIQKRFAMKSLDTPMLADGTSIRKLVGQVYGTGRSQFIHGSRPSLVEDLAEMRARAELLAHKVLRVCIAWLHDYEGPDHEDAYRAA